MFKVLLENKSAGKTWEGKDVDEKPFSTVEKAEAWLKSQIGKPHRMPEREVPYDENIPLDIIKEVREIVLNPDSEKPVIRKVAVLKQEFTYELIDLSKDIKYLNEQINSKRIAEYPSIDDLVDAIIEAVAEGKPEELQELQKKRKAIKEKYPKSEEIKAEVKKLRGLA